MQTYLALCSVLHVREQSCSVTHTELTMCLLYVSGTVLCVQEKEQWTGAKAKPTSPLLETALQCHGSP